MALIWADGFNQYGTSASIALANGYSDFNSNLVNNAAAARTGNIYATNSTVTHRFIRRPFPARNVIGIGCAYYVTGDVIGNFFAHVEGSTFPISFRFTSNLTIQIHNSTNGNGSLIGETDPCFTFATWFYLELKIDCPNGRVTLRVNGQEKLVINGLPIGAQTYNSFRMGKDSSVTATGNRMADFVIWDGTGTINNDFLGPRRCFCLMPNSNGPLQDWTPSVAPAWGTIDERPPNTTDYIEAINPGAISEFGHEPLPVLTSGVAGIVVSAYAQKTDAGPSTMRLGIKSDAIVDNSAEIALDVAYQWITAVIERDPNGSIPWTREAVDASLIRVTREA